MLKRFLQAALLLGLAAAFTAVIVFPVLAQGEEEVSCPSGWLPYAEVSAYMEKKHSETVALVAKMTEDNMAFVVFASPEEPRGWTSFILSTMGCATEVHFANGTGWPLAIPHSGAGSDAKVAP